jgi:type IV pilus assembly protein PilW
MKIHKTNYWRDNSGITLVEILVTLAITGIVSAAIFSVYNTSLKTHTSQTQVADVQQDIRAGLFFMTRELRMAGYDATNLADATITPGAATPGNNTIQFTFDLDENGSLNDIDDEDGDGDIAEADPDETVSYALYTTDGIQKLGRTTAGTTNRLVEYAEALGMAYAIDDGSGRLRTNAGGTVWAVIDAGTGNWFDLDADQDGDVDTDDDSFDGAADGTITGRNTGVAADPADIRAVRVWLLARTEASDSDYTNNLNYVVGNSVLNYNDNFRRRLLTSIVKCRNMGL